MVSLHNRAKEQLVKGELSLGLGLRMARTMDIGRILDTCGYDWAFIDMEHSTMSIDTAAQMAVACQDAGVTPLVRVPGYEHYLASRVLDGGAMGIVFPHVDTAEHAAKLVSYCKYPPQGHRSSGGPNVQLNFRALPALEAAKTVNEGTLIVIMLESPQAIANAEEIAAVPGVDVVFIGANDLTLEMGMQGQFSHPDVEKAFTQVIAACRKHGKYPGFGGVYDENQSRKFIAAGMRFILSGGDLGMMMKAATERAKFLRSLALK
ncbi:MAG: aldolase/citrate lyase family protein [Deltaproteobacteria bacterium]|nr:aldolase/citrate lyase family protein [Deltaproteobacteria bacterium]